MTLKTSNVLIFDFRIINRALGKKINNMGKIDYRMI